MVEKKITWYYMELDSEWSWWNFKNKFVQAEK